jgi:hypothetical protein
VASSIPHLLLDEDGAELAPAAFAPGIRWQPGETIVLGALQSYRVLERREAEPGRPVTLVVERL